VPASPVGRWGGREACGRGPHFHPVGCRVARRPRSLTPVEGKIVLIVVGFVLGVVCGVFVGLAVGVPVATKHRAKGKRRGW
jgi:hypothetical protein